MPSEPSMPVRFPEDQNQLNLLSVCHYVCGGMLILFSLIGLIYVGLGIMIWEGGHAPTASPPGPSAPPTGFVAGAFIVMGSLVVIIGSAFGIVTIVSGRLIRQARQRVFSLVMAGLLCVFFMPFGTILGIFTFIVLLKPSVTELYRQQLVS